jgi:hypothetical protein
MRNKLNDRAVVDTFITHLKNNGYPNINVDRIPDEENRISTDIDAIADNFAIEHTSIDTITNQRRASDWFMKAVGGLERELGDELRYRLSIVLPYNAIEVGQNWSQIRENMNNWVTVISPTLSDGSHNIPGEAGIPFQFHVTKSHDRQPGLFFSRYDPNDNSLPERLKIQIERKACKLKPYQENEYSTILLVESNDIALMNESIMLNAIQRGFNNKLPDGVDQVWFADTSISEDILFSDFTKEIKEVNEKHLTF